MSKWSRCILAVVLVVLFVVGSGWSATKKIEPLKIGQKAPFFSLPGVDGRKYRLNDFAKADVLVVIFTCNHCPTAQAYEERIKKLAADYKNRGVAVVAISPNDPRAVRLDELGYSDMSDSLEDMKIRAKDRAFKFPYLYDGDAQRASRAYGPVSTPHVFIFDRHRKLRYVGRIDDSEKLERVKSHDTRNAIDALLAGKNVPIEKTRMFGCSVKWSSKRDSVGKAFEKWAKEKVTLEMIDADGVRELAKNNSDRLRLVNVWATWCGACVIEFEEFVNINRMYRRRDFELITISADLPTRKDKVLSFLKAQQASCKNYIFASEDKYELMEALDKESLGGIPYTILVKPGGEIMYRHVGLIDPLELKKVIVGHLGRYYE